MSRGIKLVLMGVAGAALLYSCTPGIGAGLGALPYLWFLSNPFYRPPDQPCPPARPMPQHANHPCGGERSALAGRTSNRHQQGRASSQRGGFGGTGSSGRLVGHELNHAP